MQSLGPTNSILLKKKGYCIGKSIHIPTHRKANSPARGVHEKSFRLNEQDSFKLPSLFRDLDKCKWYAIRPYMLCGM